MPSNTPPLCKNCGFLPPGIHILPPSPVPHLLHTNEVPSPIEAQAIRDSIPDVQKSIAQLDQSIARARQILNALETERQPLSDFVKDHTMLLSPARRLYSDLWSEIILYSRDESFPYRDYKSSSRTKGPLRLAQVCQAWRTIAVSTPTLWSIINVSTSDSAFFETPQLPLIQTWLARSRACPLTLCITGHLESDFTAEHTLSIFRLLAEQAYRWQDVHFVYPQNIIEIFTAICTKLVLPQIQKFTVYTRESVNLDALHFGSSLDTLGIHTLRTYDLPLSMINFSQSTRPKCIELGNQVDLESLDMCLDVLRRWPDIDILRVHCSDTDTLDLVMAGPIHHTQLHTLIVHAYTDSIYPPLLDELNLPSLQKFDCKIYTDPINNSLNNFLSRSPSITHFRVHSQMIEHMEPLFRCMPSLTQLEVTAMDGQSISPNTILRSLVFSETGHDDLLPQLQNIKLQRVAKFDPQHVIEFIKSRWRLGEDGLRARIQSVCIQCCDPDFEGLRNMAALDEFRREGLHVHSES